jgi:hypothetical protein
VAELDLSSLASVRRFAGALEGGELALLINNTGIMMTPQQKTADGFELQFGTNHLGYFALTGLLLERLGRAQDARVVTLSSLEHKAGPSISMISTGPTGVMKALLAVSNRVIAQGAEQGARPTLYAATAPDVGGGEYYGPGRVPGAARAADEGEGDRGGQGSCRGRQVVGGLGGVDGPRIRVFQRSDVIVEPGGYRLENEWHYLFARA